MTREHYTQAEVDSISENLEAVISRAFGLFSAIHTLNNGADLKDKLNAATAIGDFLSTKPMYVLDEWQSFYFRCAFDSVYEFKMDALQEAANCICSECDASALKDGSGVCAECSNE